MEAQTGSTGMADPKATRIAQLEQENAALRADQNTPVGQVAAEAAPVVKSVIEELRELPDEGSPHQFVANLRTVAGKLAEDGRLVEADLLTPSESSKVHATALKLLGEIFALVK